MFTKNFNLLIMTALHYAAELYAFLFFQIFLGAIRRCAYLQDLAGNLHLAHHWGIQVIPILTIPFWGNLLQVGNPAAQPQCKPWWDDSWYSWQNHQLWPVINHGSKCSPLWEEEAVSCARKRCGEDFFFHLTSRKCKDNQQAEEVRAQGWPCSASAGPGPGEQNDGKLSDSSEQQGAGPALLSNPARTDSTRI